MPLVTIVTPSYNQGNFIERTIQSVLDQDYKNIEYIVIDGGSTDNTIDILTKYGNRIKWISEPDNGQADAINKGFKLANGEIIAWLNSDDLYYTYTVREAVKYFEINDTMMVYGDGYEIDEYDNIKNKFYATQNYDLWKLIYVWDYILQPTVFIKKEVLNEVGYLDTSLNWCMDWDLWIRIGKKHHIEYINLILAKSRVYSSTKTSTGGLERFKEIVKVMRQHGELKYPPGYFVYGVDTLDNIIKEKIGYFYFIFNLFNKIARHICSILSYRAQGVYNDAWLLKHSKFIVLARNNTKPLFLKVNGLAFFLVKIRIKINGVYFDRIDVGSIGEFTYKGKIDSYYKDNNNYIIEFMSNREKKLSIINKKDLRKASFLLRKIEILREELENEFYF
jgi:glycosyltransferase involved in cell wall biosynthesis